MLMNKQCLLSLVILFSLMGSACAPLNNRPASAVALPEQWSQPTAAIAVEEGSRQDWWKNFNDPKLNALIDQALQNNSDLAIAALRVQRARLRATKAGAGRFPTLSVSANAKTTRTLETRATTRNNDITGTVSYELDLWGRAARAHDAARWEAQATEFDRAAARLSLIGTVATFYWELTYLNQKIKFDEENLADAEKTGALVRARYTAGIVSKLDLANTETSLADQRAAHSQLQQTRTEKRHALTIVLNRPPETPLIESERLPETPLPAVEAGLPTDLLGRRPDLSAAEYRLRAKFSSVSAERLGLYPTFSLTASLGSASKSLARVLQNPIATLGANLILPFLQWPDKQLALKVSQNEYEEAVVKFQTTLYTALGEVENALSARMQLLEEAKYRQIAFEQARQAETLAQARFRAGVTDVQPWLEAQGRRRNAQDTLQLNRRNQFINQATLYKALGGAAVAHP
jgi:NodT family efflux transporter outer membrane factor (OMF) lipoprotein